jgi:YHS domain-containing protein
MKHLLICTFMVCIAAGAHAQGQANSKIQDKTRNTKTTPAALICVVSGKEADKEISSKYEGKAYYFCCKNCQKKFEAEPAKYVKKDQATEKKETGSAALKTVNTRCPVSGEELSDDAVTLEHDGKLYGFCCANCRKKFEKDPGKYLKGS